MSKYIIDVGDAYTKHICGKGDMLCLPIRINEFEDNWLNTNIPLTPYTEPDLEQVRREEYEKGFDAGRMLNRGKYEKGLNDAWEAARKIADIWESGENDKWIIVDDSLPITFASYSASETIERIRQHEWEQEQIQVGDEVIAKFSGIKYVIVKVKGSRLIGFSTEWATCDIDAQFVEKTGRHFPEIATALEKMRGE